MRALVVALGLVLLVALSTVDGAVSTYYRETSYDKTSPVCVPPPVTSSDP